MACSHNVVFLLDTAVAVEKRCLHLCTLKILNYLGVRFGRAKVRWDFKFFDSLGTQGRTSRVGSFRELSLRAWEDFEDELENSFGNRGCAPPLPGPVPRATLAQNILKETLLDYQWDRPEIASPTKPVLRSQKSKFALPTENPPENPASGEFVNAVFLFSPCPHSQKELLQFVSGSQAGISDDELPSLPDMAERFLPKGIQNMMACQKIALYWFDTSERFKLLEPPDRVGYWMLVELVRHLGGTILPFATLARSLRNQEANSVSVSPVESRSSQTPFRPWSASVPFESTLSCLFSLPSARRTAFPSLQGALLFQTEGGVETWSCAVNLEPLALGQRHVKGPVSVFLRGTVAGWHALHAGCVRTENWAVQGRQTGAALPESPLFQQVLKCILAHGLHMVAEVSTAGFSPPCTGIFSPTSDMTAILSLIFPEPDATVEKSLLEASATGSVSQDGGFNLPDVVDHVLSQSSASPEGTSLASPTEALFPEWARQELSPAPHWSPALIESWYPLSNLCGAGSHWMESFGLRAGLARKDEEDPNLEANLTHSLSEFYQRKSSDRSAGSHRREPRRRHGVPRTPVRQKMRTMPRSLQMLNVARLNVKAQKFQPEGEQPTGGRGSQRLFRRRSENTEEKGKAAKSKLCFSTTEEMLSYIAGHYQRAVATGESLCRFAREMVTAVSTFQKPNEEATADTVRSSLLRSSQALRQHLGCDADKEARIKECQLQVYLRLEMWLHCPSLQTDPDGAEDLVEEVTELLRILCLTKDPVYLARFLEEVVDTYVESMPKLLGDLYYSLGTQIPAKLASVLPADLFSDDSISQEGQTPNLPASVASVPGPGPASFTTDAEELEELRSRSAKKRRSTLARHRSVTEAPQNLRQIEVPQVPKNRSRKESARSCLNAKSEPAGQKGVVQEVTKVRRNLFNEKMLSPCKRSLAKIPRSQSVSALEGLKRKGSQSRQGARGGRKLLTESVAETPLHKQISRRLLHKQIKGRCSDPGPDVNVVEESPEKNIACGLRRSPRIQRRLPYRAPHGSFYRAESGPRTTQQGCSGYREAADNQENAIGLASPPGKKPTKSPKSLLFGALLDEFNSGGKDSPTLSSDQPAVYATPRKSPPRSSRRLTSPPDLTPRRSPRIQQKLQHALRKTPSRTYAAASRPGDVLSPRRRKSASLPEGVDNEEGRLPSEEGVSFLSRVPARQETSGEEERGQEALDEVFASPSRGSDCVALLSLTPPPCLLKAAGELRAGRRSPRCSSRVAQKSASKSRTRLELRLLAEPGSVPSEETPRASSGALSELSPPRPEGAGPAGAFSPAGRVVLLPDSPLWEQQPLDARPAACAVSPARTPRPPRPSAPREPPSRLRKGLLRTSPVKPRQPSDGRTGNGIDLSGQEGVRQGRDGTGRWAETISFCRPPDSESRPLEKRLEEPTGAPRKRFGSGGGASPDTSRNRHSCIRDAVVLCEPLDSLALALAGSRGASLMPRVSSAGKVAGVEHQPFGSPLGGGRASRLATATLSGPAYALRCTPDRRQREAAARLEHPENLAAISAPRALRPAASPPTYEVELEMQTSGLPKLRIKRLPSGSAPLPPSHAAEPGWPEGEATASRGEPPRSRCSWPPGRQADPPSASPSCVRSAHSTPGKWGAAGQRYLCQAYTPTRFASPSQGSVPWTPSPRQKGKVTPEAIKDWPRRKRAGVGGGKSERPAGAATGESAPWDAAAAAAAMSAPEPFGGGGSKPAFPSEFELEGISRLPDRSPSTEAEPSREEGGCREPPALHSRKRALESTPPEEGIAPEVKRSCWKTGSPSTAASSWTVREAEEVSGFSGLSPPSSSGKNSISARGLRALTESPLLYRGHPGSLKKRPAGEDSDAFGAADDDVSPFRGAVTRRRSLARTYSRKRLLP